MNFNILFVENTTHVLVFRFKLCLWILFELAFCPCWWLISHLFNASFNLSFQFTFGWKSWWRENRTLARCCCNCASNFRAT